MGNMQCPAEDAALLASVARDICPFPNYNPSLHYLNMLTVNSSVHLSEHYTAVQTSLTLQELDDFTRSLRTTFGRKGRVTLGGVGVVALSLAVLFDTLAKQVRGEWVSDSGPIPGLFVKDPRGYYPQQVSTISEYLRLVPHIANNPTRMKIETERYFKRLNTEKSSTEQQKILNEEDVTGVNLAVGQFIQRSMRIQLHRITNSTTANKILPNSGGNQTESTNESEVDAGHVSKTRRRRIPAPENSVVFNLNCDPEAASKDFLDQVQKSNHTQEAFKQCQPFNGYIPKTWLHFIARLVWLDSVNSPFFDNERDKKVLLAQREDFDLKANALRKWAE